MKIDVNAPEAELATLLAAVERGEEVELVRGEREIARVTPAPVDWSKVKTRSGFRFGILPKGSLGPGPDWFEPMDEADLRLWEGRGDEER